MAVQKLVSLLSALFFGAMFSISTANANFFVEVDRDSVRDVVNTQLPNSNSDVIHTPDGRFVILATLSSIVVYSREPETGALEQVFTLDEFSFDESGNFAFSTPVMTYDAERGFLYIRGQFGFPISDTATNPALAGLFDIMKLQFDSSTGMLSFVDVLVDPDNLVFGNGAAGIALTNDGQFLCLLYTSPSPRDGLLSRMPSSA